MRISAMGFKWWVLFITPNKEIEHSVGFEGLPNVASLVEILNELNTDVNVEFSVPVDELHVMIIQNEEYLEIFGDLDLEEITNVHH